QEGGDLEMSYQSRFLSDVLRVIEEPQVVIEMGDGLLPAVVYGEGDEAYRYVVMPVRVG
ncbi:MAG: DNA polymerase III subunit beta, partial [Firmicutes bacterium]|nr:DNA polymerase III subunit beta [Bacillota bacterium]